MNSYLSDTSGRVRADSFDQPSAAVVAALREFAYPLDKLPLCPERKPFAQLPTELCARIAHEALTVPERRGRLTDIVRDVAGQEVEEPGVYTIIESHVGLTTVDPDLTEGLLALGFEPHSFAGEQPTGYHYNFTQQFVLNRPHIDAARLRNILRERTDSARQLVQDNPRTIGFIEAEVYRSECNTDLPARPLARDALDHFPHAALMYEKVDVPTTAVEEAASGVPVDSRRAADLHLKLPGRLSGDSTWSVAERIEQLEQSRTTVERELGDLLVEVGFYQQVSQSGNFLYTAHYGGMKDANNAFTELSRFAVTYGGLINVVREACTSLWRKSTVTESGETRFAAIPPLLVGQAA